MNTSIRDNMKGLLSIIESIGLNRFISIEDVSGLYDFNEAVEYLGIEKHKLYILTSKKAIPFTKKCHLMVNRLYFKKKDLDKLKDRIS